MSYIEIHLWDDWYSSVYEDFMEILDAAGVSAEVEDINFSGFHSQGDGASFTGNFYLNEVDGDRLKELLPEHHHYYIVDPLVELAQEHSKIQGKLGRNSHSNTMEIADCSSDESYCDDFTLAFEDDEGRLLQIFRNLADYLYSQLRDDYEFQVADQTCHHWNQSLDDFVQHESELKELQESFEATPPADKVQVAAIKNQLELLEYAIEHAKEEAGQLADQFYYWKDGKSMTIQEFHNEHF